MRTNILYFLMVASTFGACGPSLKVKPEFEKAAPTTIAILPIESKSTLRNERIAFLNEVLRSELENRGFYVLSQDKVSAVCSDPTCSKREQLVVRYPIQAFAKLYVDSDMRTNLLAGYYNTLSGKLSLVDAKSDAELVSVDHRQNETGGLLFSSGQVFQGLKDTATNFGDDSYNGVAAKFVKALVLQIPKPKAEATTGLESSPEIRSVNVRSIRPLVNEICAASEPGLQAALVINKQRTTLRETSMGNYCGVFRSDLTFDQSPALAVEVRTPFGTAARSNVALEVAQLCNVDGFVRLEDEGSLRRINVACLSEQTKGTALSSECSELLKRCNDMASKFFVYRSPAEIGPFEKVGETKSYAWTDRMSGRGVTNIYEVVSVSSQGAFSRPFTAREFSTQQFNAAAAKK